MVGPQVQRDSAEDDAAVRLHALSQDRFPSWCSGPCGCLGRNPVRGICSSDNNNDFLSCANPQLEAIGHTRTCLQLESGGRHYAQSAA